LRESRKKCQNLGRCGEGVRDVEYQYFYNKREERGSGGVVR